MCSSACASFAMTASAFDWERGWQMAGMPKFTERAAEQISRLEAFHTRDLPPGKYMSCVAWGGDLDAEPGPILGVHEVEVVTDEFQVECHGVKLAYSFPEDIQATLHSSVLDFDGKRFVFVQAGEAERV